ncbi:hypothetical protein [Paractinoplanes toevensis]|uniref:Uncharacterized protein n=1 Tax=Paractinoplanes toevensis TaxID=571911 RepID=A0A919TB50_9ACTN|nr:hypothetical protein [Actinoplanes toevensis]GIM91797.1 hypothetical protein Ato02nite_035900 [Actinoplanes toevensis]
MRRWAPVAVVGGLLAWTALATPLSVAVGEYFAYYDPQSDPERLEFHRDLAAHVYTTGHWLGQLVAALAGAWLVARSGVYRPATIGRAALAGVLLGLVTGAVAIAAGIRPMRTNGYPSVAADPTMLSEPALRWCLLASSVCFPLWAIIGAAIGGLMRRGGLVVSAAAVLCQPVTLLLVVGVVAPPSSHPVAVSLIVDTGRAALQMVAILLAWATVATAAAIVVGRHRRGTVETSRER